MVAPNQALLPTRAYFREFLWRARQSVAFG